MRSPISFSGLGSGIDIETLVSGLVNASKGNLNASNQKISSAQAAVSTLSGVGTLLSELRTVIESLDTATEVGGYQATSSHATAVAVSSNGASTPGSYSVKVVSLASEQRSYGSPASSRTDALGQTGTLRLNQAGADHDITVLATDSLDSIASKVNDLGKKMSASVFYDGTDYRLQIRSTETGQALAFGVSELGGLNLGFTAVGATKQAASDSVIEVDTFQVSSSTNTVNSAISGVTLELKEETASEFTVQVKANPEGMKKSLKDFVEKYNAVISRIHSVAGFGGTKASSQALRGDSTLRSIADALSRRVIEGAGLGGAMDSLADLGIRLNSNGTLRLDETKMSSALNQNPAQFARVLAGDSGSSGVMDLMRDLVKGFSTVGSGILDTRKQAFNDRIKLFQAQADREQRRLDLMEERLRKQLNSMDATVGTDRSASGLF